jgi:hypothetical protein
VRALPSIQYVEKRGKGRDACFPETDLAGESPLALAGPTFLFLIVILNVKKPFSARWLPYNCFQV